MVAAASRVPLAKPPARKPKTATWQADARIAAGIPELKQVIRWRGAQMAKLRLYAATLPEGAGPDAEPIPVTDEASGIPATTAALAVEVLSRFRSRIGGQAEIQRRLETNLSTVGETWVVYLAPRPGDPEAGTPDEPGEWTVCSISEVEHKSDHYIVKRSPGIRDDQARVLVDGEDDLFRVWEPDDEWYEEADCALRGCLDPADTLALLAAQVQAEARSGTPALVLCVPNELSIQSANPAEPAVEDGEPTDPFQRELEEHLDGAGDPTSRKTLIPLLLRGPGEHMTPDRLRTVDLARKSDATVDNRITATVLRLARGMDAPVEVLQGMMNTTFCVDDATEVLTIDGWRRYEAVAPGTLVMTLNHQTGISEWQPALAVNRFDVVDEPVLRIERQAHSSVSTRAHRWPVLLAPSGERRWRTSEGGYHTRLNSHSRLITAAPCRDVPSEQKWSDEMVEMVAWFYTEGHIDRRGRRDRTGGLSVITQSSSANPGHVARIRNVLERMVGPALERRLSPTDDWAWREYHDPNVANVRFYMSRSLTAALELLAPDKRPTAEFIRSLTPAQLELFLAVSVLADGWVVNSGTVMFSQNDPARIDGYELAAILSGRTPSRYTKECVGYGTLKGRTFTQHFCSISTRTTVQPIPDRARLDRPTTTRGSGSVDWTTYSGVVWCPTTANGTWMARRNGSVYFTGNSNAAAISEDTWSEYLQPRATFLVDAVTVGYYRAALIDEGVSPDVAQRIFVWYDASDLIAQPNVEANADGAYDRNEISGSAYRRVKGFDDADAPEALEILVRTALKRGAYTVKIIPAMLQALAEEAGVEFPPLDELSPRAPDATQVAGEQAQDAGAAVTPAATIPAAASILGTGTSMEQLAALLLLAERRSRPTAAPLALRASARPTPPGERLAAIDAELRTRLLVLANDAMARALERAGNRLRGRTGPLADRLRAIAPRLAASTLGPALVAEAGLSDADLLAGAFDSMERDFLTLGALAQTQALDIVAGVVGGLTPAQREIVEARHAADLAGAWAWLRDALLRLASERLWNPDPAIPANGEFDPTLTVAPGIIRAALSLAGGAVGLVPSGRGDGLLFRSATNEPAGGIATGETMRDTLRDNGGQIEGWQWDYGPAFRMRPYPEHLALDGVSFTEFDSDVLSDPGPASEFDYAIPGDHVGCCCQIIPVLLGPDEAGPELDPWGRGPNVPIPEG